MTLLVTEIHVPGDLGNSPILFCADSRITPPGKASPKFMKKIVEIPHLHAGVGYYGLAELRPGVYFSGWLPNVISNSTKTTSLREFAEHLCGKLNREVDKAWLKERASGFHICGHNASGLPELWHICNHGMDDYIYKDFAPEYHPSEDFLRRDAREKGFNGVDPTVNEPFAAYYINGDVRPFHSVWKRLDRFVAEMFSCSDFRPPRQPGDYVEIAKWKMTVVASFYKKFAREPLIGGPPDAFLLLPESAKNGNAG